MLGVGIFIYLLRVCLQSFVW